MASTASADGLIGELALSGRLLPEEMRRWLDPLGVGEPAAVLVFDAPDPRAAAPFLQAALSQGDARGVVTECEGLLCAVVGCEAPVALAAHARTELRRRIGDVKVAVGRPAALEELPTGFHEARCALAAAAAANGHAPEVASYEDLGAVRLLLSVQDGETLASYCRTVLGPVQSEEGPYGEELLRSVDVFIEHNGHWERAAKALYCHRHTLRYRVRRVEQLTGRDFARARDRIEFWLALRGRELMR